MSTLRWLSALFLLAAVAVGCSRSRGDSKSHRAPAASPGVAVALPEVMPPGVSPPLMNPPELPAAEYPLKNFIPPFPENANSFSSPRVVIPLVTREPDSTQAPLQQPDHAEANGKRPPEKQSTPPLRLLGFVDVEGLRALLSVDGKLTVTTLSDSENGGQIIAVEPPAVTLKQGDKSTQMNLFEQNWFQPAQTAGPLCGQPSNDGQFVQGVGPSVPAGPGILPVPALPESAGGVAPAVPSQPTSLSPGLPALPQLPMLPGLPNPSTGGAGSSLSTPPRSPAASESISPSTVGTSPSAGGIDQPTLPGIPGSGSLPQGIVK